MYSHRIHYDTPQCAMQHSTRTALPHDRSDTVTERSLQYGIYRTPHVGTWTSAWQFWQSSGAYTQLELPAGRLQQINHNLIPANQSQLDNTTPVAAGPTGNKKVPYLLVYKLLSAE